MSFISELTSRVPQGGYGEHIYRVSSLWQQKLVCWDWYCLLSHIWGLRWYGFPYNIYNVYFLTDGKEGSVFFKCRFNQDFFMNNSSEFILLAKKNGKLVIILANGWLSFKSWNICLSVCPSLSISIFEHHTFTCKKAVI